MASPDASPLLSLAESVADGSPVDWASVARDATPAEQAIIRQLQHLADLAAAHRSLPASTELPSRRHASTRSNTTPAIGSWAHLELLERLGRGTFGEVYRAWDRHLEREVALKLLHGVRASDEAPHLSRDTADSTGDPHVGAILREARLLARVRHANVVHVYGVAVHESRVGLWMELIRGETLEQSLVRTGPLNAREAALVGIDLCRALAAIHAAGLIHRDIKAQNVMRETGGRIVLMDLGTGRPSGRSALPDLAGTPLYFAPEILTGAAASERTDVYSLGVLLYHLVTGAFPVVAGSLAELEQRHAAGEYVRLRDARADLPTAFVSVVDGALAHHHRRYQSAGALEAALVATLDDKDAAVHESSVPPASGSRGLRWRSALLAAAVAAAVALGGVAWPTLRDRWIAGPASIDSIAVLPIANLSGDPAQEYFADGMTEAVISTLAKLRPLRVISRTSVMSFKGTTQRIGEIARTLDVDAVLEASVLQTGGRIRLAANLVEAATERPLWTETYERDVRDVLALQNDLARTIAQEIRVQLSTREEARFAAAASVQPAAHDAYLRGRYHWNRRTSEALQTALEHFREAARLDPTFARAYAGQADTYNLLPGGLSPFVAYPLARDAARRALDIDPMLAEAHTSLAFTAVVFDRDWEAGEAGFRRAIELSPGYATAHHWYAELLSATGRHSEAFAEYEAAKSLDPLSAVIRSDAGRGLYFARRYSEAMAEFQASLRLNPSARASFYLAQAYEQAGMLAEADQEVRRGLQIDARDPSLLAESARLAALRGDKATALGIARDLAATAPHTIQAIVLAEIFAVLGDSGRVFEWLNRAEADRLPAVLLVKDDPAYDFLRSDPRFIDLLRRLRLDR